jgi:antitoxin component HigA of HigAB toxin-antitoxin module
MLSKEELLKQIDEMKKFVEAIPEVKRCQIDEWTVRDSQDISVFLQSRMKQRGMNNNGLAGMANLTPGRISQILNNKTELNLHSINKLLELFDCELVIRKRS